MRYKEYHIATCLTTENVFVKKKFPADLVRFTEEVLNGKPFFLEQ